MSANTDGILMTMSENREKALYCDRCKNEIQAEFTYIDPILAGWVPKGCKWNGVETQRVKKTYYLCQPCVRGVGMRQAVEEIEEELKKKESNEHI